MAGTFPESPKPIRPFIVTPRFNTKIIELGSGMEERRSNWLFPVFDVVVRYKALNKTGMQTVYDFLMDQKGSGESFYIYDLKLLSGVSWTHKKAYCGTTDGVVDAYDIPGRETSGQTVYMNDVAMTESVDYDVLVGGGKSGSDRMIFATVPDAGKIITVSFTGYRRFRVRLDQDSFDLEMFTNKLFQQDMTLKFVGLKEI